MGGSVEKVKALWLGSGCHMRHRSEQQASPASRSLLSPHIVLPSLSAQPSVTSPVLLETGLGGGGSPPSDFLSLQLEMGAAQGGSELGTRRDCASCLEGTICKHRSLVSHS